MRAYFVRKTSNQEVVGVFFAPSTVVLAALVDEYCDPALCDFAVTTTGGLVVPMKTTAKWPMKPGKSSVSTGLEGALLTQQWENDLDAERTLLEWKSLRPAVEQMLQKLRKGK